MDVTPYQVMVEITGTLETPGDADNPKIIAWSKFIGDQFPEMRAYCAQYTADSIAWCGLTQAYAMARAGIRPPYNPAKDIESFLWAQAWKKFGTAVVGAPQRGDVLVFARHVTMFDSQDGAYYVCRGGNQSDSVKLSRYRPVDCEAVRRPPAPSVKAGTVTPSPTKMLGATTITATVFGGASDPNTSAYDGHVITDSEMGVSLPYHFPGTPPKVKVTRGGKSIVASIVDVGPWNTEDPYWLTGARPQAESGRDMRGRKTNLAGIDLTPAAARALGVNGKGTVDWEFVGVPAPSIAAPAVKPTGLWARLLSLFTRKS